MLPENLEGNMVKFVAVDPADIPTERLGRRGRVSYPLIKSFMEMNIKVAKLDPEGLNKNQAYLRSVLGAYIKSHSLPIKIFAAGGDLHLMRLDLNNDNTPIPDYQPEMATTEGASGHQANMEAQPITAATVAERAAEERPRTTK
jgi:hypothetical protein